MDTSWSWSRGEQKTSQTTVAPFVGHDIWLKREGNSVRRWAMISRSFLIDDGRLGDLFAVDY